MLQFCPKIIPLSPHCRLVGDSGTVLRREVRASDHVERKPGEPGGDQEPGEEGTVRRGRGGKVGRNLGRRHSRASSLDRREIYQKYIHTDRSVGNFTSALPGALYAMIGPHICAIYNYT